MAKTDTELANPGMPAEERLARMISRGLGHNDSEGMDWDRYVLAARLILRHCHVTFETAPATP